MEQITKRKKLLSEALNSSFVEDYQSYKNIVENINETFKELEIDYQWSYDDFCVNFLNESLDKLEVVDIFSTNNFQNFYQNFWNFNLIVIREIVINKFDELGYDYSEYEEMVNNRNYLNSQQIKN